MTTTAAIALIVVVATFALGAGLAMGAHYGRREGYCAGACRTIDVAEVQPCVCRDADGVLLGVGP